MATNHYSYEHTEELKPLIEWRDYTPEAFSESIDQNKPIFLLLTAPSWCYWCQVYESEEFLFNPQVIEIINSKFIPVYVDADQRQDLTRKYLEGGWPSTTIFTPGRERLYGFSGPRPVENMVVNLENAATYVNSRGFSNQVSYNYEKTPGVIPNQDQLNSVVNGYAGYILQLYDSVNGGFGSGQKFPQGRTLDFSLELYELTGNEQWLEIVQNTLRNQYTRIEEIETNYNLFDPIEGGFHRYGTQQAWTPPHYEKMLYDNARLLKTYSHLQQLTPEDNLVVEVVAKTENFILNNWWDAKKGGFYGNSDVHGEDEYYGKFPRPKDKPRVEKTKYSDWNSDAILTYLYLWQTTKDEKFKEMADKSLKFFANNMVTEKGAYHYIKENTEKGVRGSLLDNSYLLLAFVEGYEVFGDEKYLDAAIKLADYSLENLYDWNSGGFFERNSPDKDMYALGEHIDLSKPRQENGIISYAMLKLYRVTNNLAYLNAGIKTSGFQQNNVQGLDRGYYDAKTAQFIVQHNLLEDFEVRQQQIKELEKTKLAVFWLNKLVVDTSLPTPAFIPSEEGLEKINAPILFLIPVALLAGLISFASPCTLPILPAYIAYSMKTGKKNLKAMTLAFFLGLSVVFTLLGMSATLIGSFLKSNIAIFSQVSGIVIILFGYFILLGKGFPGLKVKQKKPTSYVGSFIFGATLGISWTPCVGPILVSLLLLASTTSSFLTGGILLFVYGLGLALPLILISSYLEKVDRKGLLWKIIEGKEFKFSILNRKLSIHSTNLISGLLFILLGYLIFSGTLFAFNQYVSTSSFQKIIFGLEDWLLSLIG